jgi:hypothetical protein
MEVVIYLLLGLAAMGGLFWLLTQITARQRRVNAELTRLERLAAEVSMNAEAVMEQVEDRIAQLQKLADEVQAKAVSAAAVPSDLGQAPRVEAEPAPIAGQVPAPDQPPAKRKRGRPRKVQPPVEVPVEVPASPGRYQALRAQVVSLAGQAMDAAAISRQLGMPRGEVQLILNLLTKKSAP